MPFLDTLWVRLISFCLVVCLSACTEFEYDVYDENSQELDTGEAIEGEEVSEDDTQGEVIEPEETNPTPDTGKPPLPVPLPPEPEPEEPSSENEDEEPRLTSLKYRYINGMYIKIK